MGLQHLQETTLPTWGVERSRGRDSPQGAPELGQVGAWPWGPASPASSAWGSHTGRTQLRCATAAHRRDHGSQSRLDPPRTRPFCRLTGGPGGHHGSVLLQ